MPTSFACPACRSVLKTKVEVPAGKKLKCPKCATVFAAPEEDAKAAAVGRSNAPPAGSPGGPTVRPGKPTAGRQAPPGDNDEDDKEERRERKRSKKRKKKETIVPLLLGVGGGLIAVLLILGLVWPGFLVSSKPKKAPPGPAQPAVANADAHPKGTGQEDLVKFPISKETTYVTGPLDKEGYIDYQTALNDRLGRAITPEKNANVLLMQALGPRPEGARLPAEFFQHLGINEPPERGDYFISLGTYGKDQLKLNEKQLNALFDQEFRASRQPWTDKDYPDVAAWLKANEKPLAVVIQAVKRPEYYNPLVSAEKGPGGIARVLLPSVQKCREVAGALTARALLRAGEGKFDDAWQDLLACHRLGRLVARGGTLIEGLVGVVVDLSTSYADLAYVERPNLTSGQIRSNLKDIQALAPLPPMADKMELQERFLGLDNLQLIRRGGTQQLEALAGGPQPKKLDPGALKVLETIDWEPVFRTVNQWYDRVVAAMQIKDRGQREQELDRISQDVKELSNKAASPTDAVAAILGAQDARTTAGKKIGEVLIGLLLPAFTKVQQAGDRTEQVHRNLELAFALAAYQRDEGRYPANLNALAPKYLAAIPDDLFSGKALIYRPSGNGYLLYSVGVNGRDEGGRDADDNPPGDDLAVRMPLPALKHGAGSRKN